MLLQFKVGVFVICSFVKTIEIGTALGTGFINKICLFDEIHVLDALAEVTLVELFAVYSLIESLELSELSDTSSWPVALSISSTDSQSSARSLSLVGR